MNEEKIEQFKELLKSPEFPILTDNNILEIIDNPFIIDATSGREYFSGNPSWVKELNESNNHFLVIKNIDYIHPQEQLKLVELLKYKKIETTKLKNDLYIIVTVENLDFDQLDEEIVSLTVQL